MMWIHSKWLDDDEWRAWHLARGPQGHNDVIATWCNACLYKPREQATLGPTDEVCLKCAILAARGEDHA